jgi:hypothetical protein
MHLSDSRKHHYNVKWRRNLKRAFKSVHHLVVPDLNTAPERQFSRATYCQPTCCFVLGAFYGLKPIFDKLALDVYRRSLKVIV